MLFPLKLNNRNCGKMLTVTSVQNSGNRQFVNNSTLNHGKSRRDVIKNNTRRFVAIAGICFALIAPINRAFAQPKSIEQLSVEWWQWALSIPTSVNPQIDDSAGQNAFVGQHGSVWFLAGVFSGGKVKRTCAVPERTQLFFPVINGIAINIPNVCGQGNENLSANQVHAMAAEQIAGATYSVTLDGTTITNIQPAGQATAFAVALPVDNIFNAPCGGPGTVPAGIYSPAAGDGFYVLLDALTVGKHTLRFRAAMPPGKPNQDVTYNLTVVPVSLQ
jgi:hypothetical protein